MNFVKGKIRRPEDQFPASVEYLGAFLGVALAGWFDRPSSGPEWLFIKHGVFYASLFLMYLSMRIRTATPYFLGILANGILFLWDTMTPGGTAVSGYGREMFLYLAVSAFLLIEERLRRTKTKAAP